MNELEKAALISSIQKVEKDVLALSDHLSDIVHFLKVESGELND